MGRYRPPKLVLRTLMRSEDLCVITVSPQKLNYTIAGWHSDCKEFGEIIFEIIANPIEETPILAYFAKNKKAPPGAFQLGNYLGFIEP